MSAPNPTHASVPLRTVDDMEDAELYDFLRDNGSSHEQAVAGVTTRNAARTPQKPARLGAGAARMAAQGLTLGFGDEIEGAVKGLIPGGDSYAEGRDAARKSLGAYREAYPKTSVALEVAGSLPLAAVTGGAGSEMTIGRLAAEGAVFGATQGAGAAEGGIGQRLLGAGKGAVVGGAGGAAIGGVARTLRPAKLGAHSQYLESLRRDGRSLVEIAADAQSTTKPLTLMDLGGKNTLDLAKTTAQLPGEGKGRLTKLVTQRSAGMEERVLGDAMQRTGNSRQNIFRAIDDIAEERSREAEKLYSAIADKEVTDSRVLSTLKRGPFRKAYDRARNIRENENASRLLRGEAPLEDLPELDQLIEGGKIKLGTLDQVKRGLDDVLQVGKRSAGDAGGLGNEEEATLRGLKNGFLDVLDQLHPEYKAARSAFAGKSAMIDAMEEGKKLFSMPADKAEYVFSKLGDSEKEAFRKGALEAFAQRVEGVTRGHDVATRLGGKTVDTKRIRMLFGAGKDGDRAFAGFLDDLRLEAKMERGERAIVGGSDTASKAAVMAEMLGQNIGLALDAATGNTPGLVRRGLQKVGSIAQKRSLTKQADELTNIFSAGENGPDEILAKLAEVGGSRAAEAARLAQARYRIPARMSGLGAAMLALRPSAGGRRE